MPSFKPNTFYINIKILQNGSPPFGGFLVNLKSANEQTKNRPSLKDQTRDQLQTPTISFLLQLTETEKTPNLSNVDYLSFKQEPKQRASLFHCLPSPFCPSQLSTNITLKAKNEKLGSFSFLLP